MLFLLSWLASSASAGTCDDYSEAVFLLNTDSLAASESSGLAASRTREGIFFTHDDSGSQPQIYSFSLDGSIQETHSVDGASAIDWEDMAAGPCPDSVRERHAVSDCLYIGDIGDNPRTRDHVQILVTAEPAEGASLHVLETWRLRYPDEPRDSETLLVHPGTGQLTLVTKTWTGAAEVFTVERLPALAGLAEERLRGHGDPPVRVRHGDGFAGWSDHAPFDAVLVSAATREVPAPLLEQLRGLTDLVLPRLANHDRLLPGSQARIPDLQICQSS